MSLICESTFDFYDVFEDYKRKFGQIFEIKKNHQKLQ